MSRKLLLDPLLAIHSKIMAKKIVIFKWKLDLFLTLFRNYGHIYVPNGIFWGFSSRPHIGDLVNW